MPSDTTSLLLKKLQKSRYYYPAKPKQVTSLGSYPPKNAEWGSKDFKGLPDLSSIKAAQRTAQRLEMLYDKYKKENKKEDAAHVKLVAEIARNEAYMKGSVEMANLFDKLVHYLR